MKKHRLLEKEGTMTSDLETDEMRSFSKAEEENYNRECICNNCRRSSSPSCKNEVNKEFDFLGKINNISNENIYEGKKIKFK